VALKQLAKGDATGDGAHEHGENGDDGKDSDVDGGRPRAKRARVGGPPQNAVAAKQLPVNRFLPWPEQLFDRARAWEWRPMSDESAARNNWKQEQEITQDSLCGWMCPDDAVQRTIPYASDGVTLTNTMFEHTRAQVCNH